MDAAVTEREAANQENPKSMDKRLVGQYTKRNLPGSEQPVAPAPVVNPKAMQATPKGHKHIHGLFANLVFVRHVFYRIRKVREIIVCMPCVFEIAGNAQPSAQTPCFAHCIVTTRTSFDKAVGTWTPHFMRSRVDWRAFGKGQASEGVLRLHTGANRGCTPESAPSEGLRCML